MDEEGDGGGKDDGEGYEGGIGGGPTAKGGVVESTEQQRAMRLQERGLGGRHG